jgi:hypothetical protein
VRKQVGEEGEEGDSGEQSQSPTLPSLVARLATEKSVPVAPKQAVRRATWISSRSRQSRAQHRAIPAEDWEHTKGDEGLRP